MGSKILDQIKGDETLNASITVKVPQGLKDTLQDMCDTEGVSMGKLVRLAISNLLEDIEAEE